MVSQAVGELVNPLNDLIFKSIPYLLLLLFAVIVLVLIRKAIAAVVFKLHKHDALVSTNKWWDWEEYENEKKRKGTGK